MPRLPSCFRETKEEIEEVIEEMLQEGTDDPSLRCEANFIFSLFQSLLNEITSLDILSVRSLMDKPSEDIDFIESEGSSSSSKQRNRDEYDRALPNPMDLLKQQFDRFDRFHVYLSEGIPVFYSRMKNLELDKFEFNSLDSVLSLLIIGVYYGTTSQEYQSTLDGVFKDGFFDPGMFRIALDNILNLKKKFHDPELGIDGKYLTEDKDPNCYRLPETCKIALVSDWATGTKSSFAVLKSIATHKPEYFIHLGDVYYSGRLSEHKNNLVEPIQRYLPNTRYFTTPGNHDYYSGSKGIKYSLKSMGQNASYFSLYNSKIQFEGLDTGFNDSNCFDTLVETAHNTSVVATENNWHQQRVQVCKNSGRKLCFLSHHMVVSPWTPAGNIGNKTSPVNPALWEQYSSVMTDIDLWFYGHDHSFAILDPYTYRGTTLERPRMIGNGSAQYRENPIDVYNETKPTVFGALDTPNPSIRPIFPSVKMSLLNPCYVICDISSTKMIVEYYELPQTNLGVYGPATVLHSEVIYF